MDIKAWARRNSRPIAGIWFPLAAVFPLLLILDISGLTPKETRVILAIALPSFGIGGAIFGQRAMHREWAPTLRRAATWGCSAISLAYVIAILAAQLWMILTGGFASGWFIIPVLLKMLFDTFGSGLFIELLIIGSVSGLIFNRALADRGDSSSEDIPT